MGIKALNLLTLWRDINTIDKSTIKCYNFNVKNFVTGK